MYWKKLLGITTLSCNEGSIRLRPECPWKARRYTIVPEESVQYWYLFLSPPPPAKHTLHLLSDQWGECGDRFWRFSLILPKWTAPNSSRCIFLWMTKKIHYLLRYFIIGERIFPWFKISPSPPPNRNYSWWRAGRFSSLWFCFCLWSACKIFRIQFQRIFFELNFWNFCPNIVQIHHKPIWSMRNSDPGVSIVSVQRPNSDLNSIYRANNSCNFIRAHFCVPLDPSFWLWCFFFSSKSVFTTSYCMKLWEICSVFRPEVLSNLNNIQKSCIHTEFTQFVLLWQLFISFSILLQ